MGDTLCKFWKLTDEIIINGFSAYFRKLEIGLAIFEALGDISAIGMIHNLYFQARVDHHGSANFPEQFLMNGNDLSFVGFIEVGENTQLQSQVIVERFASHTEVKSPLVRPGFVNVIDTEMIQFLLKVDDLSEVIIFLQGDLEVQAIQ